MSFASHACLRPRTRPAWRSLGVLGPVRPVDPVLAVVLTRSTEHRREASGDAWT